MAGRLAHCRNWAVYYGWGRPGLLEGYDLLVLAPDGWDAPTRRDLQRRGAVLLAYLSVLEVPTAPPAWVLGKNEAWSTWILDPRHPSVAERVLRLGEQLRRAGWDGLFLDTIGDVETPGLPPDVVPAAAHLVADLAAAWPEAILVQNWGLGALLPLTAPYLDGLCWEDFPDSDAAWPMAERLQAFARDGGLRLLALSEKTPDAGGIRARAAAWGFLWYGAPGSYIDLPPKDGPP